MFITPIACVLIGCLQDVPVYIGTDPIRYHLTKSKQTTSTPSPACYIEGVFYKSCPKTITLR